MLIQDILSKISMKSPSIVFSIGIFIFFWITAIIFKILVRRIMDGKSDHANISQVLAGIVKNIILIIGIITALGTLGVNISAIVAGLGLTGFAFGFAFKDMLSNFISGIMIFIYEPFKLGDYIEVDGKKGKVININLRYVTLIDEDQNILVPNSLLVSKSLVVKGKKIANHVNAMIVPGSGLVKQQAEKEGIDKVFKEAGFDWREPGCSMCLAMNADKLNPQERCASTSNRNFEGRQGRGGRTHLVSPAMAAAAAIDGCLTDVRKFQN